MPILPHEFEEFEARTDEIIEDATTAALLAYGQFAVVPNLEPSVGHTLAREALYVRRKLGKFIGAVLLGDDGLSPDLTIAPQRGARYEEKYTDLAKPPLTRAEVILGTDFFAANTGLHILEIIKANRHITDAKRTYGGNLMPLITGSLERAGTIDEAELARRFDGSQHGIVAKISRDARKMTHRLDAIADALPTPAWGRPLLKPVADRSSHSTIPAHLLDRAKAAREASTGSTSMPEHLLARSQAHRDALAKRQAQRDQ